MLARLSIRDIVLIERLDIEFSRGLAVLTGETGAGKSILLDAFALALGGRGDAGLVRHGVEQGQVTGVAQRRQPQIALALLARPQEGSFPAQAQVLFSEHDLGGALARGATGTWEQAVMPGGDLQRERAIRLAVNVAMYVLCSNYKDDQVHAPFLMRRRALSTP